jgi:hypothetical protein
VKQKVDISKIFPKHLFWDVEYEKLDLKKDKDLIIPRALYATTRKSFDKDISKLEKFYSKFQIVNQLKHTKERISNEVCRMVADRYHIDSFARFEV